MSVIFQPTDNESRTIARTRDELRTRLEGGDLSIDEAARRLGLVPEGVQTLLRRGWSFEEAYRVASALGFDFVSALNGAYPTAR
jgi:hypothetical protein